MKASAMILPVLLAELLAGACLGAQARHLRAAAAGRMTTDGAAASAAKAKTTIGKIVKMLEEMLEKSKETADEEKELYAKFKCYCDDNKKEKETTIEEKTE